MHVRARELDQGKGAVSLRQCHGQEAASSAGEGVSNIVVLRDGSFSSHDDDSSEVADVGQ